MLAQSHIDALLENTSSALGVLASLSDSFKAVDNQTTAFRARCEGLLAEQQRMTKIAGQVEENLQYYSYLDPINRRLNAPNAGAIVGSREFSEMLATIDHCLKYMKTHVSSSAHDFPLLTICSQVTERQRRTELDMQFS